MIHSLVRRGRERFEFSARCLIAAAVLFVQLPIGGLLFVSTVQAQNPGQRVVHGVVVNDVGTLLSGATVFIKDLKSKSIRSYTTPTDGSFRFTQVSMNEDHEVWAEKDGKKSAVKTVSTWDTRTQYECELKVK